MTRLTSRSDGRGEPLTALIARWAAGHPQIRRAWLFATPGGASADAQDIALTLELRPVGDSEETLAVWMAHSQEWGRQLDEQVGQPVALDWHDPDDGMAKQPGPETLVYERIR